MLTTDPMSTHRCEKKWSCSRLEQAAATIAGLLEVTSYYVTTSPTEFKARTGHGTGRALGRAHASSGTIYVGLRHKRGLVSGQTESQRAPWHTWSTSLSISAGPGCRTAPGSHNTFVESSAASIYPGAATAHR
ncbi:MAG: hypothetical protein EXR50_08750 [Dehalococcoidia bacterium]|nr:hypothetical protein [Dehalococcoidia bacterium]